ncbi:MAG TPA: hypothetical protein ENI57_01115 [Ignavibacteria bacterium]|nr:hypothetical protein [Ignavibacteria bacterium]
MSAITEYIKELQSYEEYSFSWEELLRKNKTSRSTLRKELARLSENKDIINLRKGFYLILPPRYRDFNRLPVQLYINKLFNYLKKPYYLALYSAALQHGASHQQIQKDYIITKSPALREIKNIRFFKCSNFPVKNILKMKSDAGFYNVSSPVLTAIDLIHYQNKIGGLNRILTVLIELLEKITISDLIDLLTWYPQNSTLQRLGFLLEELKADIQLTSLLYEHLKTKSFYPVLLRSKKGEKAGTTGNKWRVDVNIKLESDL